MVGFSQTDTTATHKGKPIIQIFGHFDHNVTQDAQKKYGFWSGRAHFGYEYQFNKQFSCKIIINVGHPATVGQIYVTDTTDLNLSQMTHSKNKLAVSNF